MSKYSPLWAFHKTNIFPFAVWSSVYCNWFFLLLCNVCFFLLIWQNVFHILVPCHLFFFLTLLKRANKYPEVFQNALSKSARKCPLHPIIILSFLRTFFSHISLSAVFPHYQRMRETHSFKFNWRTSFVQKKVRKCLCNPPCRRQENDRANSVQTWLESDYATFVHIRVRKGQRVAKETTHPTRWALNPHSCQNILLKLSYTTWSCKLSVALLPSCTATYLHCYLFALLPSCTATCLHCCLPAPLKCTTAGFHNWPIFQAALSAKVLQNSQSKQSTKIFC